jgi:hypothetical protein
VKFVSRGPGYSLFLTPTEAVFQLRIADLGLRNANHEKAGPARLSLPSATSGFSRYGRDPQPEIGSPKSAIRNPKSEILRLRLVGANPSPQVRGLEELPGKSNYFIGDDPSKWRTNVPNYAKVEYREVYPGVNLVYYGNQRQLEHDFVVAPGADPNAIRFAIEGADKLELDAAGDLVLHVAGGKVCLRKPVVYQEVAGTRREIAADYVLRSSIPQSEIRNPKSAIGDPQSQEVGFQVAAYDRSLPLVIDPVLAYSTYLGGSMNDYGYGIAVDSAGNAYVTGPASSTDFPTASPLQPTGGYDDAFVAKLNAAGSALVYSTYLGGSSGDSGTGVAVDSAGNAYVTGYTYSTNFPTASPLQPANGGGFDAFVTKLNAAGSALVYSTYLGGSDRDDGYSIAVDSAANAYVTGETWSTNFPTASPLQAAKAGQYDAFVAKLNAAGSALVYSTYLGGSDGGSAGNGIAVDPAGNAYVTGNVSSQYFPTASPLQAASGGTQDAFVAKLNTAGSALVYSTYLGGSEGDYGHGIAVDSAGNAYVTGETSSTNFPTVSPLQAAFGGGNPDAFVAKLNAAGSGLVYSTYLGGSGTDSGTGIAVDSAGNAYVTGRTDSTAFPTASPLQATRGGSGADAFVAKLNAAGSALIHSTYLGGSGADYGLGIAVDTAGNAYITGLASAGFPLAGAFQPVFGGGGGTYDAFIAKISSPNDNFADAKPVGGVPLTDTVDTSQYTTEAGDPTPSCGGGKRNNTVWYSFTPTTSGWLTADTFGSNYDTVLSVWTGAPGSFTQVACNDDAGGAQSQVGISVTAGTTYYFMVSAAGAGGTLAFHLASVSIPSPVLVSTNFYGGSGDQRGTGVAIANGQVYVAGNIVEGGTASDTALLAAYALPPAAPPAWSFSWPYGTFFGLVATNQGLYLPGYSYTLTTDNVGGKENKSILTKFPLDGATGPGSGGSSWVATPNFFSYTGGENFSAMASAVEGGTTYLYAAGGGQPCSYYAYTIAKYDTSGTLLRSATDSTVGIVFNQCYVPASGGGSAAYGVAALNGSVYAAGNSSWASEGDTNIGRATIWKYDASLNLTWRRKDDTLAGQFNGVTALGNAIYAAGYSYTPAVSNSEDYLIEKYDEAGNLAWRKTYGGADTDILKGVVGIGSRLFAVGYTKSQGSGGADAVVLEIDPASGSLLSTTLFGGALDDVANGVASDGADLYVVGESRSFASAAGNVVGQNEVVLLRYAIASPAPAIASLSPAGADAGSGAFTLTVNGSNFVPTSVVRWNGADRPTTFVSDTRLTAAIAASDITTGGTAQVTVYTPAPGGGTSAASSFAIQQPVSAPTITSLSPASAIAGTAGFTLTVNGTNFISTSVVRWNGSDRGTTFVDSTKLTAAILATDIAAAGTAQVTVYTPPPGGTSNPLAFPVTLSATPAAIVEVSGNNQTAQVNTALASPLVVQVNSATGGGIAGATVEFAVTPQGGATLSAPSAVSDASGQAQVGVTMGTAAGAVTISASVAGVATPVVFTTTALAGPPTALAIVSGNNQTAVTGSTLPSALVVKVTDQYGNAVSGVTVNFVVTAGSGSLGAASATTGADGQTQVTWTLGSVGANTVQASSGTMVPVTFSANALPGPPASVTTVSGNNQTATVGAALAAPLVVYVADQQNNPLSGVTVNFAITGGGGSLGAASALTGSNGQAQVSAALGTVAGPVTISASVAGLATPAVFAATALAGPATALVIVSGNNQAALAGTTLPAPLVVKATDQYGNAVADVALAFAVTSGGGGLSATFAATGADGQAQVTWTLGSIAGNNAVQVSSGTLTPVTFRAVARVPYSLTVVSGDSQSAAVMSTLNPLVVAVADQFSNALAGVVVNFSVTGGSATLSVPSATTDSDGRAQATLTLGATPGTVGVTATVTGLPAVTFTATATVGAPASLVYVSGNNQTGLAGSTLSLPLVVKVADQYGNAVPGAAVGFAVTAGGGSVNPPSVTTDASGLAQAQWTLGAVAGVNTAQATVGTLAVTFSASGAALETVQGAVAALAAQGSPGGVARVPVVLTLNNGIAANSVSFGIRVLPVGTAIALTDPLDFEKDAGMPEPSLRDTSFGVNAISVSWLGLANSLTGTVRLGEVLVPIPSLAADGQTYTVRVTGAGGASGDTDVTLAAGADALLSVSGLSYLVGDTYPLGTDKNSDSDTDDAGEFGNDALSIVDLIYALRAVTGITGWRPPACSDRFDAMDAYPADTPTVRGGDGKLSITDLIITLRRVTGVDTNRPRRYSRNMACPASAGFTPMRVTTPIERPEAQAAGLELGAAEAGEGGKVRIPLYLVARGEATLAGVGFAVELEGAARVPLSFVANDAFQAPSLVDDGLPGVLALAWLDAFRIRPGQRVLLGWVEAPGAAPALRILGFDAPTENGARIRGEIQ